MILKSIEKERAKLAEKRIDEHLAGIRKEIATIKNAAYGPEKVIDYDRDEYIYPDENEYALATLEDALNSLTWFKFYMDEALNAME